MIYGIVVGKHRKPHTLVEHLNLYRNQHDALASMVDPDERLFSVSTFPMFFDPEDPVAKQFIPANAPHVISLRDPDLIKEVHYTDKLVIDVDKAIAESVKLGMMEGNRIVRSKGVLGAVKAIQDVTTKEFPKTIYDYSIEGGWQI